MTTTLEMTASERRAITALLDSTVLPKAVREHRAAQAARRKEVRARRSEALTEVQQGIAKAAALMDKESEACQAAYAQLNGARARHRAAQSEWWGLTATLEAHNARIERELGDLADERCSPVDSWLQTLIQNVRASVRHWTEPKTSTVKVRGTFGILDHEVTELVPTNNLDQINATVAKLVNCRNQVQAVVMESDALDVGPDLKRIHAAALDSLSALIADGSLRPASIPELAIED